MKLRDFQERVLEMMAHKSRLHQSILVIAPTAAGKTVLMSAFCAMQQAQRKRCLVLVDMDVLVQQTHDKFKTFGSADSDIGFIKAGYPEARDRMITIASLQTMARRHWWKEQQYDYLLFDEAHVSAFSTVGKAIASRFRDSAIMFGFTATPWRLSKRQWLGQLFETSVLAPTPLELQRMGYLSKMVYYSLQKPDLKGVALRNGEYKAEDLELVMANEKAIATVISEWRRIGENKPTIAFCVNIAHAEKLVLELNKHGIPSALVTGDTPRQKRELLYEQLRVGDLKILVSVMVISIGFDLPIVENALLLRPTKSKALHFQQIGRVMRIAPEKTTGRVLDFTGNCLLWGLPEHLSEYDYDISEKQQAHQGEAPVKECPECKAIIPKFAKVCPECGHEFGEVSKVNTSLLKKISLSNDAKNTKLIAQAKKKGLYKPLHEKYPNIFKQLLKESLPQQLTFVDFDVITFDEQRHENQTNDLGIAITSSNQINQTLLQNSQKAIAAAWSQTLTAPKVINGKVLFHKPANIMLVVK